MKSLRQIIDEFNFYNSKYKIFKYITKKNWLEPGNYKIYWSANPRLYNIKYKNCITGVKEYRGKINALFNNTFHVEDNECASKQEGNKGQIAIISFNNNLSILDINNKTVFKVLTLAQKKHYLKAISELETGYTSPFISESRSGVIEEWIDGVNLYGCSFELKKKIYLRIIDSIITIYKNNGVCVEACISNNLKNKEIIKFIKLLRMPFETMPYFYQHCDIHIGNLLLRDDRLYYIDFEYAREEYFLYDIINICYVEYTNNDDSDYLYLLMNDDTVLKKIKNVFDVALVPFDSNVFDKYLNIYLICRIKFDMRVKNLSKSEIESYLSKYKKFYNCYSCHCKEKNS